MNNYIKRYLLILLCCSASACVSSAKSNNGNISIEELLNKTASEQSNQEMLVHSTTAQAEAELANGKVQSALKYAKMSVRFDPSNRDAKFVLGKAELANKNYAKASQIFEELVEDSPTAEHLQFLGLSYFYLENIELARNHLLAAFNHDPSLWMSATILGRIETSEGNYNQADKYFEKALYLEAKSGVVHDHQGHSFKVRKSWADARKSYEIAQSLSDNVYGNHDNYRLSLAKTGQMSSVLKNSTPLQIAKLYRSLGQEALTAGLKSDAVSYLQKARSYFPRYDNETEKLLESALLLEN